MEMKKIGDQADPRAGLYAVVKRITPTTSMN
jgi:hypothetical protein